MPIGADIERGTGLQTGIDPIPHGNPAPGARHQRAFVVIAVPGGLQAFPQPNTPVASTHHVGITLGHGVDEPKFNGIHAELGCQLIDHQLKSEGHLGHAGGPVGMNFGLVGIHRSANGTGVTELVTGRCQERRNPRRVTVVGPRIHEAVHIGGHQPAVPGSTQLDPGLRTRGRAGGAEYVAPVHDQLHRSPGLARQHYCNGFKVDRGLTAKAATDLRGRHPYIALIQAGNCCCICANRKVPLGTAPQVDPASAVHSGNTGVGFDVALVAHGYRVGSFDNDVGLLKRGIGLTHLRRDQGRQVGGLLGLSVRETILMEDGRPFGKGGVKIGHRGQHIIANHDGCSGLGRQLRGCRRHGCDRLCVKQHFALGHHHGRQVPEGNSPLPAAQHPVAGLGQIVPGHDRQNTGHGQCLAAVNLLNTGMGVGAAQDMAVDLVLHIQVGAIARPPRHLVQAIGSNGPGTHHLKFLLRVHDTAPSRIERAASSTAAMILS